MPKHTWAIHHSAIKRHARKKPIKFQVSGVSRELLINLNKYGDLQITSSFVRPISLSRIAHYKKTYAKTILIFLTIIFNDFYM